MKKADKVAAWKDICLSGKSPPVVHEWTDEDEQQLMRIKNREVDMSETYLGRGCTGEISKKKIFSKPFFSQCNLVDMVCRMNIHQDGF
jgi:hypothetical protein